MWGISYFCTLRILKLEKGPWRKEQKVFKAEKKFPSFFFRNVLPPRWRTLTCSRLWTSASLNARRRTSEPTTKLILEDSLERLSRLKSEPVQFLGRWSCFDRNSFDLTFLPKKTFHKSWREDFFFFYKKEKKLGRLKIISRWRLTVRFASSSFCSGKSYQLFKIWTLPLDLFFFLVWSHCLFICRPLTKRCRESNPGRLGGKQGTLPLCYAVPPLASVFVVRLSFLSL